MALPIDINKIKSYAKSIQDNSDEELCIDILVDTSIPKSLFDFVRKLLTSDEDNVVLNVFNISKKAKKPSSNRNLCVVLCGQSQNCFISYVLYQNAMIPTCLITLDPQDVLEASKQYNFPITKSDVIIPELEHYSTQDFDGEKIIDFCSLNMQMRVDITEKLSAYICRECGCAKILFGRAFNFMAEDVCKSCINSTAIQNAGVGIIPLIPGADMPVMTLNQAKLLLQIAYIYGFDVGEDRVIELVILTLSAFLFKFTCNSFKSATSIPGFILNGAFGFGGTYILGHSALSYFKAGGNIDNLVQGIQKSVGNFKLPDKIVSLINKYAPESIKNMLPADIGDFNQLIPSNN